MVRVHDQTISSFVEDIMEELTGSKISVEKERVENTNTWEVQAVDSGEDVMRAGTAFEARFSRPFSYDWGGYTISLYDSDYVEEAAEIGKEVEEEYGLPVHIYNNF